MAVIEFYVKAESEDKVPEQLRQKEYLKDFRLVGVQEAGVKKFRVTMEREEKS